MSIFKSTFSPFVKDQLKVRQDAMVNRTPQNLQYLNSRNAWVRMSSSVDVNGDKGALARKYILQGGILNTDPKATNLSNISPKSGIGDFSNAYSNQNHDGVKYQRGIRPMPGITSVDIKSKSAYGSLREVTVNFQCWDIQQLEDLEVLYMRPGYTVLIEWGWTPYLDNKGVYQSNFTDYYDIINKTSTNRTQLFRDLYDKSTKYGGNYDATFGYIKNYTWSARMDGGYDCTAVIISTGELIESLKLNYLSSTVITKNGLLNLEFNGGEETYNDWKDNSYDYNVLAGIWKEAYCKLIKNVPLSDSSSFNNGNSFITNVFKTNTSNRDKNSIVSQDLNAYITIGAIFDILNKYVIAKSETDKKPLVELSVHATDYDGTPAKTPLTCIAHPLQISVDPRKCLIKNKLWDGIIRQAEQQVSDSKVIETAQQAYNLIKKGWESTFLLITPKTKENLILDGIKLITDLEVYNLVNFYIETSGDNNYNNLQDVLNGELGVGDLPIAKKIEEILERIPNILMDVIPDKTTILSGDPKIPSKIITSEDVKSITITNTNQSVGASLSTISQNAEGAIANLQFMDGITLDYFNGEPFKEIGTIKNIYVNIDYLYKLAINSGLEAKDTKGKNEINIYNYIKQIMSDVQSSIGNINSFEIHVDPVDNNVARVIDINYTGEQNSVYDSLFQLQIHDSNSIVRTYSLQSQIFPEQSSIIAIGSQAQGGQMGIQNNTMIDFNANLIDRILTGKTDGQGITPTPSKTPGNQYKITNGLAQIISLFSVLDGDTISTSNGTPQDYNNLELSAKNSLRDIIAYFQSITLSPGSNRNLIPTKFSCEMDGIGGLVIGHMFRLPNNVLPKGYRGEVGGVGSKLANAITSVGHVISNNDWVTKVDSLNIVMDNPNSRKYLPLDINSLTLILNEQLESEISSPKKYTNELGLLYANKTEFKSNPTESANARKIAETYVGRKISDSEWNQLIAAVVAESGGNENGKEDAYIAAVMLNRSRSSNISTILGAKNQFQAVTGRYNLGPSISYITGPGKAREKQIYKGIETYLPSIDKRYKNFTSNNPLAYKSGTNIQTMYDYRANKSAVIIGGTKGTVFAIL